MANKIQISYDELVSYAPSVSDELKIGVAISGGRDSVALLHCLKALESESVSRNPKLKIVAVNIEHGIRGEESISDSAFVKELCEKWNVPLVEHSVNAVRFANDNGYTLEQAARILRYEIFDKLIAEGQCDLIALAHHLDDQVETVFMRILRGTGIRGLVGMKKVSGRYIRPLLGYYRESIDEYIKDNGLSYVEDGTNSDTAYTRNYLRQELAELKKRFPQMGEAVARLTASADEVNEFINAQVHEIEVKDGVSYIKTADCENSVIAKRLILKAANALGVMQDIEDRHYALVLNLLSAENGKYLMLTHGLCVHKEGDRLAFTVSEENVNDQFKFSLNGECVNECGKKTNGCCYGEREFAVGAFDDLG
ncbi:MAG: tRNA lysidine(34) synthetase TilS, partial [Clostridia bacterium]|nr:tRNA lysidine(34) synthetase TilS [Clostridia bacterium]